MFPIIAGLAVVGIGAYVFKKYQESQSSDQKSESTNTDNALSDIKPINIRIWLNGQIIDNMNDIAPIDFLYFDSYHKENSLNQHYFAVFNKIYNVLYPLAKNVSVEAKELPDRFEINIFTTSEEISLTIMNELLKVSFFFLQQGYEKLPELIEELKVSQEECLAKFNHLKRGNNDE